MQARGAEVVLVGDSYSDAQAHCDHLVAETGLTFIHPFDDPLVIAGQGTVGDEIVRHRQGEALHAVFVPVGGGGLLAGVAGYIKAVLPDVRVIGVEPFESDAMYQSLKAGRLHHAARVVEDVLDRGAHLVVRDAHDLVDGELRDLERVDADGAHRDAVGEDADVVERDAPPGLQRLVHRVRLERLDADDAHVGQHRLDVAGDAGEQAAAADRHCLLYTSDAADEL